MALQQADLHRRGPELVANRSGAGLASCLANPSFAGKPLPEVVAAYRVNLAEAAAAQIQRRRRKYTIRLTLMPSITPHTT